MVSINNSYLFLGWKRTGVSTLNPPAAANHSNHQKSAWSHDNKDKFIAGACQEAANNCSVCQVPLLKPCRSTLFLTRRYLKSVCFPEALVLELEALGRALSLNLWLPLKDTSIRLNHDGWLTMSNKDASPFVLVRITLRGGGEQRDKGSMLSAW